MAVTTGGQASTGTPPARSETARPETVPTDQLSIRNKLLFAQAVHRLGAPIAKEVGNNWNAVISLLRECPAVEQKEKGIFTEHVRLMYACARWGALIGSVSRAPELPRIL